MYAVRKVKQSKVKLLFKQGSPFSSKAVLHRGLVSKSITDKNLKYIIKNQKFKNYIKKLL